MASNYRRVHPVHALNRYLWAKIIDPRTDEEILAGAPNPGALMQTIPYNGVNLTPIVPIEETPTLITAIEAQAGMGSMPFIVYNWTKVDNGQMWFVEAHEIAYSIRTSDDTVMRQLINLFDDLFKKYDESAQRVNAFLERTNAPASLRQFYFQSINISTLGGQMPTDTEDGANESLISLRVIFT